jgi:hypothetical protein
MESGKTIYNGWPVHYLRNDMMSMYIAPQFGGRIIQLALKDHEFLYVNHSLNSCSPDASRLGPGKTWLNYGGEKVWPAPQGFSSTDEWPGPPDPILDGGAYGLEETGNPDGMIFSLVSEYDNYTGLRIRRNISMDKTGTSIGINVQFTNQSNSPKTWSAWPVCQVQTDDLAEPGRYRIICPTNQNSQFPNGYTVLHGLVNNPQFSKDNTGNLIVEQHGIVGKVGLDTRANWMAFVDRKLGKALVMSFSPAEGSYPENTSVQIWVQGKGIIYSRNRIVQFESNTTPYMEMEILSTLHTLAPQESFHFAYTIKSCTIPVNCSVHTVESEGIIAQPLSIVPHGTNLLIKGQYGVFKTAFITIKATFPESGNFITIAKLTATPDKPVSIEESVPVESIPAHSFTISVLLQDDGMDEVILDSLQYSFSNQHSYE